MEKLVFVNLTYTTRGKYTLFNVPFRSVGDAVFLVLYFILQHLESAGSDVRLLFVVYISAFNLIIPQKVFDKLSAFGLSQSSSGSLTSPCTDPRELGKQYDIGYH